MNRREAIAALTALPEITRLSVGRPAATDAIIVECSRKLTAEHVERIRSTLLQIWPDRQIVICGDDIRIRFATTD